VGLTQNGMFKQGKKLNDAAIRNILELSRITYVSDGVIRVKGTSELYYLLISENGVFACSLDNGNKEQ
jgi:hypothetical protein